jgi:HAD superfamily hydrolase (TIGR01662 family)
VTAAVVFDYGLTIVTFVYPEAALLAVLERFRPAITQAIGREAPAATELMARVLMPLEDTLQTFGMDEVDYLQVYDEAWRAVGIELPRDLLYRVLDAEQRCWDAAVRFTPGAIETLQQLRVRGLKTGIASNAAFPPEMMHRQLRDIGLAPLLDAAVFSSEIGKRKPSPELYRAVLERLGVSPAESLYVGDRLIEDYEGPRQVGMRSVLYAREAPDGVERIERLDQLEALL